MLLNEFIKENDKLQMINTLMKAHKLKGVKIKYKSMKDFAHYNVDTGTIELSTKYKTIKSSKIKEFLITMLHELYHAVDASKIGWKDFKADYEWEMSYQISHGKDEYKDNKYEIAAEKYGRENWKKWYNKFKKDNLI